jgi:hypothetical protein
MKESDLRIGNYVIVENDLREENLQEHKVNEIRVDSIQVVSKSNEYYGQKYKFIKPIPLTEELVKRLCYFNELVEDWGKREVNEWEYFNRYVFHNVLDGTSNLEIHAIHSKYGDSNHLEFCLSIDENERQGCEEIKYLHQLQNGVHFLTNQELILSPECKTNKKPL